jgi:hypothetical protein
MRLQDNPYLPDAGPALVRQIDFLYRQIAQQVNQAGEGKIVAALNADTAAPTGSTITYQQGDFVRNSTPTELGTVGSKYVVFGWTCVASGAPGTWLPLRCLTGN